MANEEHLAILEQGVEAWNKWREEHPNIPPDLRGANLVGADLREANLRHANLSEAHLYDANLTKAYLSEADLTRADLRHAYLNGANLDWATLDWATLNGADLREADLFRANLAHTSLFDANLREANLHAAELNRAYLVRADLSGADLVGTYLRGPWLNGTNVEGAEVGESVFGNVDLSEVWGLDTVEHRWPSYIDIHTLYRSKGKIPEVFLRGCGVPDTMIAFIASLVGQPETYRVRLRMMIDDHFNKSELQTLCFDMGVDYDGLNGENKSDKARELVAYFERRGIIRDLVAKCKELRPNASWEGEYE